MVNTLGSINVTGTISALSLDIQAKGNFSLQSDGWFNTGADPTFLQYSWQFVVDYFKSNAVSTGADELQQNALLKWGYRNLGSFTAYLTSNTAARDSRIFALGAVNISALTLNIDGKIQSGVTDAISASMLLSGATATSPCRIPAAMRPAACHTAPMAP